MSFAIEVHRGWRNLRVSQTHNEAFRRDVDADFERNFRQLTRRRQHILRLRAEGVPIREIAGHLGLGEQTIKNDLTVVYRALEIDCADGLSMYRACYLLGRMDARE